MPATESIPFISTPRTTADSSKVIKRRTFLVDLLGKGGGGVGRQSDEGVQWNEVILDFEGTDFKGIYLDVQVVS